MKQSKPYEKGKGKPSLMGKPSFKGKGKQQLDYFSRGNIGGMVSGMIGMPPNYYSSNNEIGAAANILIQNLMKSASMGPPLGIDLFANHSSNGIFVGGVIPPGMVPPMGSMIPAVTCMSNSNLPGVPSGIPEPSGIRKVLAGVVQTKLKDSDRSGALHGNHVAGTTSPVMLTSPLNTAMAACVGTKSVATASNVNGILPPPGFISQNTFTSQDTTSQEENEFYFAHKFEAQSSAKIGKLSKYSEIKTEKTDDNEKTDNEGNSSRYDKVHSVRGAQLRMQLLAQLKKKDVKKDDVKNTKKDDAKTSTNFQSPPTRSAQEECGIKMSPDDSPLLPTSELATMTSNIPTRTNNKSMDDTKDVGEDIRELFISRVKSVIAQDKRFDKNHKDHTCDIKNHKDHTCDIQNHKDDMGDDAGDNHHERADEMPLPYINPRAAALLDHINTDKKGRCDSRANQTSRFDFADKRSGSTNYHKSVLRIGIMNRAIVGNTRGSKPSSEKFRTNGRGDIKSFLKTSDTDHKSGLIARTDVTANRIMRADDKETPKKSDLAQSALQNAFPKAEKSSEKKKEDCLLSVGSFESDSKGTYSHDKYWTEFEKQKKLDLEKTEFEKFNETSLKTPQPHNCYGDNYKWSANQVQKASEKDNKVTNSAINHAELNGNAALDAVMNGNAALNTGQWTEAEWATWSEELWQQACEKVLQQETLSYDTASGAPYNVVHPMNTNSSHQQAHPLNTNSSHQQAHPLNTNSSQHLRVSEHQMPANLLARLMNPMFGMNVLRVGTQQSGSSLGGLFVQNTGAVQNPGAVHAAAYNGAHQNAAGQQGMNPTAKLNVESRKGVFSGKKTNNYFQAGDKNGKGMVLQSGKKSDYFEQRQRSAQGSNGKKDTTYGNTTYGNTGEKGPVSGIKRESQNADIKNYFGTILTPQVSSNSFSDSKNSGSKGLFDKIPLCLGGAWEALSDVEDHIAGVEKSIETEGTKNGVAASGEEIESSTMKEMIITVNEMETMAMDHMKDIKISPTDSGDKSTNIREGSDSGSAHKRSECQSPDSILNLSVVLDRGVNSKSAKLESDAESNAESKLGVESVTESVTVTPASGVNHRTSSSSQTPLETPTSGVGSGVGPVVNAPLQPQRNASRGIANGDVKIVGNVAINFANYRNAIQKNARTPLQQQTQRNGGTTPSHQQTQRHGGTTPLQQQTQRNGTKENTPLNPDLLVREQQSGGAPQFSELLLSRYYSYYTKYCHESQSNIEYAKGKERIFIHLLSFLVNRFVHTEGLSGQEIWKYVEELIAFQRYCGVNATSRFFAMAVAAFEKHIFLREIEMKKLELEERKKLEEGRKLEERKKLEEGRKLEEYMRRGEPEKEGITIPVMPVKGDMIDEQVKKTKDVLKEEVAVEKEIVATEKEAKPFSYAQVLKGEISRATVEQRIVENEGAKEDSTTIKATDIKSDKHHQPSINITIASYYKSNVDIKIHSMKESTPEPVKESTPEPVKESTPDPMKESTPDPMKESTKKHYYSTSNPKVLATFEELFMEVFKSSHLYNAHADAAYIRLSMMFARMKRGVSTLINRRMNYRPTNARYIFLLYQAAVDHLNYYCPTREDEVSDEGVVIPTWEDEVNDQGVISGVGVGPTTTMNGSLATINTMSNNVNAILDGGMLPPLLAHPTYSLADMVSFRKQIYQWAKDDGMLKTLPKLKEYKEYERDLKDMNGGNQTIDINALQPPSFKPPVFSTSTSTFSSTCLNRRTFGSPAQASHIGYNHKNQDSSTLESQNTFNLEPKKAIHYHDWPSDGDALSSSPKLNEIVHVHHYADKYAKKEGDNVSSKGSSADKASSRSSFKSFSKGSSKSDNAECKGKGDDVKGKGVSNSNGKLGKGWSTLRQNSGNDWNSITDWNPRNTITSNNDWKYDNHNRDDNFSWDGNDNVWKSEKPNWNSVPVENWTNTYTVYNQSWW